MIRTDIKSTIIKSVGQMGSKLEIEFRNGQVYIYSGVPGKEYSNLIRATSPGKYFIDNIKTSYSYKKV